MIIRRRLSDIAEVKPGYLARKGVRPKEAGTHHLLQVRDFNRERTELSSENLIRFVPEVLSASDPIKPGDIVFMAKGANNFAYAVSRVPTPTLVASCFFVVRPEPNVLSAYIAWFLNQEGTRRELSRLASSGVRMPVVRKAVLENIEIPVPPMSVQKKIVELHTLMVGEQTLMNELCEKKRALVSAACMKAARGARKEE